MSRKPHHGFPSTRERMWLCFRCGYAMDAATLLHMNDGSHEQPEPGDISMCLNCAAPHVREAAGWRLMRAEELEQLDPANRRQLTMGRQIIETMGWDLTKGRGGRA